MRDLTERKSLIRVPGKTVGEALSNLDAIYPGVWDRLCQGGDLSPSIAVLVDGEEGGLRLHQPLNEDSEVNFLPALSGG